MNITEFYPGQSIAFDDKRYTIKQVRENSLLIGQNEMQQVEVTFAEIQTYKGRITLNDPPYAYILNRFVKSETQTVMPDNRA